jgi:hypothetical protein
MPQSYGAHKGEIGIILASDLEPLTRGALERFRRKYNLGTEGVLDEKTELALVQRALEEIRQKSLFGQLGVLDAATRRELIRFKSERGLALCVRIPFASVGT